VYDVHASHLVGTPHTRVRSGLLKKTKQMEKLISETLKNEELIGIIPIESKRLKIKSDNITFSPTILAYVLMLLICFLPAMFLFGFFSFILLDLGGSIYSVIIVCILILFGLMYLADKIYVNYIKKYPNSALVLTNSNLYYFLIKNNKIVRYNNFEIDVKDLSKYLYGEMNIKTGKIGKRFMIKSNGNVLASGNLKIKNSKFQSDLFSDEVLLPINELRAIYKS